MKKETNNPLLCDQDVIDKTAEKIMEDNGFKPSYPEIKMKREEVIERLKAHNNWRRGYSEEMMNPTIIGVTIDNAIMLLEAIND